MRVASLLLLTASLSAAQSQAVLAVLSSGSYFPLDMGDRWVYRIDDRQSTASYQTWRIDRVEEIKGASYAVMAIEGPGSAFAESWFRADGSGRIYILTGDGERLFLDPSGQPAAEAELQVTGKGGAAATALGNFPDTLNYANRMGLILETGTLARGVGLVASAATMMTGSSGGFTQGRTLVEANVGGIRFEAAAPSVQLALESLDLDVSGRGVTNCAVPCYFVACGLVPGADPPGTFKPCARARVALVNWPAGLSRTVRLQLVAPDGRPAYERTLALDSSPRESVAFVQTPLYSAANEPLPPGAYQLTARTTDGAAQAALALKIR
ncbi:MAG: hypothetical protein LAQ30_15700 [Acidobacteriia bacterium]|nr:hypothetical protein [Terriglobia bacterium]